MALKASNTSRVPFIKSRASSRTRALALVGTLVLLLAMPALAQADKQPVDFFGGSGALGGKFLGLPSGIAVNQSGAGAGNPGDIYVSDTLGNRVERFARDDHGTPADGSDDTYSFVSAWGAGVEPSSGTGYQVCTVAEACQEGISQGIAGGLSEPGGVAVDQDTGNVYIADIGNARIDVYGGDGTFLRAFGVDVIATGPGDAGTDYEVCVPANGDVCKAGVPGPGVGQIGEITAAEGNVLGIAVSQADGNPAEGTVFLADRTNRRVGTYDLDGTSPATIGSASVFGSKAPLSLAVDSRGILYASSGFGGGSSGIQRYDTENVNGDGVGFLAPIADGVSEVQQVTVSATAGTFNLTYNGETTIDLPFNAPNNENTAHTPGVIDTVAEALISLPSIGGRNLRKGDGSQVFVRGGPGDAGGTSPYRIEFDSGLGAQDVEQVNVASGATPLSGGSGITATTLTQGQSGLVPGNLSFLTSLAVDPDEDGPGPEKDVLYVQRSNGAPHVIQQFGPVGQPGLAAPPTTFDDIHGSAFGAYATPTSLTIDNASGRLLVPAEDAGEGTGEGIYVLDAPSGAAPSATLNSLSDETATSVTAHATITPNGNPPLRYHLEYSTDGSDWESGATVLLGTQDTPQSVTEEISPPGGLVPNTLYHVRLVAKRPFFPAITTPALTFTTLPSPPLVETTGSPVRSATTARLDGRLSPQGSATTFHFEYGTQGPCDANPCTSTESHPAGSGGEFVLVSQRLEGLEPGTTYHYRLIADNGNPGSPGFGDDMTVKTFASEETLSHGHLPGPVGSDRAWELVSEDDTSGNPIGRSFAPTAAAISDDGDRAVYGVAGGTPLSEAGTFATRLFAERTPHSWKTRKLYPSRQEATGTEWESPGGAADLSTLVVENHAAVISGEFSIWRLTPGGTSVKLFGLPDQHDRIGSVTSDNGSRTLASLLGTQDPSHPVEPKVPHLYDISSGQPHLADFLPDGSVASCGVNLDSGYGSVPDRPMHWISADGSLAYFPSAGSGNCSLSRLYVRNFISETTKLVSGAPYSGSLCKSYFIKSLPGAVYFFTETQLTAEDLKAEDCTSGGDGSNGDIYRYDVGDASLHCLTCLVPGDPVGVKVRTENGHIGDSVGIAEDGSRLYFVSYRRLLPGAPVSGGSYGLDIGSGKLSYVGTAEFLSDHGESTMSADGSVVAFRSKAPRLNALEGQQNGGTFQDYLYDIRDGSLACVSCPADGSLPVGKVFSLEGAPEVNSFGAGPGPNKGESLDADGDTFIFSTPTPLVSADQNTADPGQEPNVGNDVYEWREGRPLLISDGITNWPDSVGGGEAPQIAGITPSGRDVFFSAAAQLTPDALDGYNRLYDARIGGGFEFPPPPKPCPLEVCQGIPKGAPEEQAPGTQYLQGAQEAPNPTSGRCPKAKTRRKGRCVSRHKKSTEKAARHKRAKHNNRRASR